MPLGLIIPPSVIMDENLLSKKSWYEGYETKQLVRSALPGLLKSLREIRFNLSKDVAMAYFDSLDCTPDSHISDIGCAELINDYPEQIEAYFHQCIKDKLRLLALAYQQLMDHYDLEVAYPSILKGLFGLGYTDRMEYRKVDAKLKALQADLGYREVETLSRFNNQPDNWYYYSDDAMERDGDIDSDVVTKEEIDSFLDTLHRIGLDRYSYPEDIVFCIDALDIIQRCTINCDPRRERHAAITSKEWKYVLTSILPSLPIDAGIRPVGDEVQDIDPVTVLMSNNIQAAIIAHRNVPHRIAKPGFTSLLQWLAVERMVVCHKMKQVVDPEASNEDSDCTEPVECKQ